MMKPLKIIADENIIKLDAYLSGIAEIHYLPGRQISAADLHGADALLIRSVTQVNEALISDSSIQFVGSCTIGTDHVDLDYLSEHNIAFSNAPGCNANAVVDYVLAAMFAVNNDLEYWQRSCGVIVGFGEVGSRLSKRLQGLHINAVICDPFKVEHDALESDFLQADWISLHVPLTVSGEYPTQYLFDLSRLQSLKENCLLINSSRGKVVDNLALLTLLKQEKLKAVLDVYEDEPTPSNELLDALDIATAHIAGYSLQGKIAGTEQVVRALFRQFSIADPVANLLAATHIERDAFLGNALEDKIPVSPNELIKLAYDICNDSARFKQKYLAADESQRNVVFDEYRKHYSVRTEWAYHTLNVSNDLRAIAKQLGFSV